MSLKIGIVDYGMGNLRSVFNAVHAVGAEPEYAIDPEKLSSFDKLIVPGVGAFADAMAKLIKTGMDQALDEQAKDGTPILGLCLGMQLMCNDSEEGGQVQGLGWFNANVRRFPENSSLKVPHIGWNNLQIAKDHPLFKEIGPDPDVYFVHSYRVECTHREDVLAWCDYGEPFVAIIAQDNLIGIQFHPEKSQRVGLAMMRSFVEEDICSRNA